MPTAIEAFFYHSAMPSKAWQAYAARRSVLRRYGLDASDGPPVLEIELWTAEGRVRRVPFRLPSWECEESGACRECAPVALE